MVAEGSKMVMANELALVGKGVPVHATAGLVKKLLYKPLASMTTPTVDPPEICRAMMVLRILQRSGLVVVDSSHHALASIQIVEGVGPPDESITALFPWAGV
jgi:hypothetical protein